PPAGEGRPAGRGSARPLRDRAVPHRRLARARDLRLLRGVVRRPPRSPTPPPARRLGGVAAPQDRGARRREHEVPRRVHPAGRPEDVVTADRAPSTTGEASAGSTPEIRRETLLIN